MAAKWNKVTTANGSLQATAVQAALEQAGIPVTLTASNGGAYLDILVPSTFSAAARSLIHPKPRYGEIYFVPAR
jgi:hypothetical protein